MEKLGALARYQKGTSNDVHLTGGCCFFFEKCYTFASSDDDVIVEVLAEKLTIGAKGIKETRR